MDYKIIRKENQKERLWTGGVSKELYIYPDGSTIDSPFNFRVSTASINPGEYNFTSFKGYKRLLILLSGHLKLEVDGKEHHLDSFSHIFFSGSSHTNSSTTEACMDFNLIYKDVIELLDFKIVEKDFIGKSLSSKAINIFYNLSEDKHIYINTNEYILNPGDTLIACGNNFSVEGVGKGIILSLNIK